MDADFAFENCMKQVGKGVWSSIFNVVDYQQLTLPQRKLLMDLYDLAAGDLPERIPLFVHSQVYRVRHPESHAYAIFSRLLVDLLTRFGYHGLAEQWCDQWMVALRAPRRPSHREQDANLRVMIAHRQGNHRLALDQASSRCLELVSCYCRFAEAARWAGVAALLQAEHDAAGVEQMLEKMDRLARRHESPVQLRGWRSLVEMELTLRSGDLADALECLKQLGQERQIDDWLFYEFIVDMRRKLRQYGHRGLLAELEACDWPTPYGECPPFPPGLELAR